MICLIALIVFGVMGIFSVGYRKLAKEALECVFRRVTLRKCESKLDQRIKSHITGKLFTKSPGAARFVFKNFEILSWMFTIMLILSIVYSGIGLYRYAAYGNCNGPESNGFCIFNLNEEEQKEQGCTCDGEFIQCSPDANYSACGTDCNCVKSVCGK